MYTTIIGYAFTLAALIPALRQVSHSRSCKSVAGVSAATTIAWVFSWSAWAWYGFLVGSGPVIVRNLVGLLPALALLVVFARLTPALPRLLLLSVAAVYLASAALMVVNRPVALLAMTALDIFFYAPSVVRVFKDRDLTGVSVSANVGQLVLSASWVAYLWLSGQGSASFGWVAAVIGYALIVARLMWLSRRDDPSVDDVIAVSPARIRGVPVSV